MPLSCKINKSIRTLEYVYRKYDGDVYISTGGVDSTVLAWLAKQSLETKNIECVCVATLEPTGNIKLNHDRGDTLLKSDISKKQVIIEWGYPLISKEVAMKISRYTRTKHEWVKERRLKGYMGRNGKWIYDSRIPLKYQELIYAPFELSEKCCEKTKKKPLKDYEHKTKKVCITGETAEESLDRKKEYLKHGCMMIDKQRPKCTPLGFWTDQDIKQCLFENMIPYSSEYGHIAKKYDGTFVFMSKPFSNVESENRTGCDICGFGMMEDKNRFERLNTKKPGIYKTMMQGGQWIRKDLYRWVKFRPDSMPIWSNLYWVPNDKGYGYKFVLNYFYQVMKIDKKVF